MDKPHLHEQRLAPVYTWATAPDGFRMVSVYLDPEQQEIARRSVETRLRRYERSRELAEAQGCG